MVRDNDFDLGFGEQIHDIFGTTIEFGMAALPSEATHLTDGHPMDARGVELFLDLVQLEEFDDRFNLFHDSFSSGVALPHACALPQPSAPTPGCDLTAACSRCLAPGFLHT